MSKYIVTAIDIGDTCDGHAHLIGAFKTKEEAVSYVREDMKDVINEGCLSDNPVINEVSFEIFSDGSMTNGCIWDIHEVKEV